MKRRTVSKRRPTKKKPTRPTEAERRVAQEIFDSPAWNIDRVAALTEGERQALWEMARQSANGLDPRPLSAIQTSLTNPLGLAMLPSLHQKLQRYRLGQTNAITRAVAALDLDFQNETPREIWGRLAQMLGWRIVPLGESGEAELHDAHGCRLTYPQFEKRLGRAKNKRPGRPKETRSPLPPA